MRSAGRSHESATPRAGETLLHPAALLAVAVLVLNDHALKGVAPGWLTGKLSDFAGLAFFPLLLEALWLLVAARFAAPRRRPAWRLPVFCALTAIGFALVKTWAPAAAGYRLGLGVLQWPLQQAHALITAGSLAATAVRPVALVMDASDLVALPAVLIALAIGRRVRHRISTVPVPAPGGDS